MADSRSALFPALLKHWRHKNGLSQLDLAAASEVSSRHISFLETGRSIPSPEMVVQLGFTLGVPLRHINEMLRAAGHDPAFAEPKDVPAEVGRAIDLLKSHHEPFPLMVIDRHYNLIDHNSGAQLLLDIVGAEAATLNLARFTFDPNGAQPLILNFDEIGRELLWRIQREVLADPNDVTLRELFDAILAMETVDASWREADLTKLSTPLLPIKLKMDELQLAFISTITTFQAPQNTKIQDIRIESWFPADETTESFYRT